MLRAAKPTQSTRYVNVALDDNTLTFARMGGKVRRHLESKVESGPASNERGVPAVLPAMRGSGTPRHPVVAQTSGWRRR